MKTHGYDQTPGKHHDFPSNCHLTDQEQGHQASTRWKKMKQEGLVV